MRRTRVRARHLPAPALVLARRAYMSSLSSSFTLSMIVLLAVVPYFQVMETATQIIEFVTRRMRMSHIDQPLLIRALVRAGGSATLRQLATALMEDESQ